MQKLGISSVLSLSSAIEAEPPLSMESLIRCRRIVLPDHKTGQYPTLNQILKCINTLKELKTYGSVYVHCVAAMERSPLVCMAWLIKEHDLSPQESLDYLMQVHPATNPLPEQYKLLSQLI